MASIKTRKLVIAALMTALTCIATMVIQLPLPTGGYIHLGDGLVLISGIMLGPIYGGAAAGIGSMLADLLSGYGSYAPATLIIKTIAAIMGSLVYWSFIRNLLCSKQKLIPIITAGITGGFIVTTGYLIFESYILGNGLSVAITGVPTNIVQNIFGIIVSIFLFPLLTKSPYIKEYLSYK